MIVIVIQLQTPAPMLPCEIIVKTKIVLEKNILTLSEANATLFISSRSPVAHKEPA
jgi:hypothetical protein